MLPVIVAVSLLFSSQPAASTEAGISLIPYTVPYPILGDIVCADWLKFGKSSDFLSQLPVTEKGFKKNIVGLFGNFWE